MCWLCFVVGVGVLAVGDLVGVMVGEPWIPHAAVVVEVMADFVETADDNCFVDYYNFDNDYHDHFCRHNYSNSVADSVAAWLELLNLCEVGDVDSVDKLVAGFSVAVAVAIYCIRSHLQLWSHRASGELLNKCCFHDFDSESLQSVVAAYFVLS